MANTQSTPQNPLEFSTLKNNAVPFADINEEMYLPQLRSAIGASKERITQIANSADEPTFANTLLALETASEDVDLILNIFYNQLGSHTNERLQALAKEIGPLQADFSSDTLLNAELFQRVQALYVKREQLKLSGEEAQLLDKYYSSFVRNGAKLSEEKKSELRKLDQELSQLSPQFSENVLKATNEFHLNLTDENEVAGVPTSSLEAAKMTAKEKGQSGWTFTLQAPSYIPFMQYADHRPSREKMHRAFSTRCFGGAHDNQKVIRRTLELREKRAQLLGFKNHAEYVLEKRMAEKPSQVFEFLEKIKKASFTAAKNEVKKITEFAKAHGGPEVLMPWDFSFWSERLKENLFQLNSEELRPYFKLENVIQGVFLHAEKLYGLSFIESSEYPVYHPDVKTYEVYDKLTKKFVGLFYADFFPRESKNGGAWMTNYLEQGHFKGEVRRPHVAIVCNFTKPTADKPSLLTFDEVKTFFHEFGHSLHSLLSQCTYRSLSGTNVYWDFVELPSQIMENWTLEKESLSLFARHFETGEVIPESYIRKIIESSQYLAGYMSLRQVTFAILDMHWHTTPTNSIKSIEDFENQILDPLRVLPKVAGANSSCSFSHIFAGGYSAGYYSYKWAEVLDADAFEYFKEKGVFNTEVANKFKDHILSRGGTEHPMELYKKFRGREPDADALLRRDGLI